MCSIIDSNTTCTTAILLWFSAVMNSPAKVLNKTTVQSFLLSPQHSFLCSLIHSYSKFLFRLFVPVIFPLLLLRAEPCAEHWGQNTALVLRPARWPLNPRHSRAVQGPKDPRLTSSLGASGKVSQSWEVTIAQSSLQVNKDEINSA